MDWKSVFEPENWGDSFPTAERLAEEGYLKKEWTEEVFQFGTAKDGSSTVEMADPDKRFLKCTITPDGRQYLESLEAKTFRGTFSRLFVWSASQIAAAIIGCIVGLILGYILRVHTAP